MEKQDQSKTPEKSKSLKSQNKAGSKHFCSRGGWTLEIIKIIIISMTTFDLEQEIRQMRPATKAARLRALMPAIEAKLAAGVQIKEVQAVLQQGGLDFTVNTLSNYLYRYRKQRKGKPETMHQRAALASGEELHQPVSPMRPRTAATEIQEKTSEAPPREPVSMQELARLIRPDPVQQAKEFAYYEQLGKQRRRNQNT
jgi:hypothetical protein